MQIYELLENKKEQRLKKSELYGDAYQIFKNMSEKLIKDKYYLNAEFLTKKLRVNTCEIIAYKINLMLHAEVQKQNPVTQAVLYSTTPITETCNYHPFSCLHQNSHISMPAPPSQPFPENSSETFLQYSQYLQPYMETIPLHNWQSSIVNA